MDRVCSCGCGDSLHGRRSDCRYASESCRARAFKRRRDGIPAAGGAEAFWGRYSRVRPPGRASRAEPFSGRGVPGR